MRRVFMRLRSLHAKAIAKPQVKVTTEVYFARIGKTRLVSRRILAKSK